MGLRLTLSGLADVGPAAFAVVVACIATALVVSKIIGRMLGLSSVMQGLLAVGSAVCGCTAIVATSPAIRARPVETGVAVTCVVLIGSLGMLTYPWLAAEVLHERTLPVGIFLGSAIHDTSQVVGASLIYAQQFGSPDAVGYASATKLFRNLSIIILVPLMAWSTRPRMQSASSEPVACRPALVPQFVIWFVVFVLVRTLGDQLVTTDTQAQQTWLQAMSAAQVMSDLFMTCGMTAVGLGVSLTQMHQVGFRPVCAARDRCRRDCHMQSRNDRRAPVLAQRRARRVIRAIGRPTRNMCTRMPVIVMYAGRAAARAADRRERHDDVVHHAVQSRGRTRYRTARHDRPADECCEPRRSRSPR